MTQTAELKTWQFESHSGKETISVGHRIVALLTPPKFLILRGDLGAGKTTLVKGIAEALDAADPDEVTSPTFTLIHEYEGSRSVDGRRVPVLLYHLDLYRIQNERQLDSLGLEELSGPDSLVLVEWGEKFASVLKRSQGEVEIRATGGDSRSITLTLKD
ncbi:MAG TPA: tRNA (adenosine(37)-N6)-threonylcarbamoyltransferase complex ATPase subunit type 1 TsaE [Acidobacteriaceae bacterium]|jgi:tRNA threonylcarbamoyladenosine biosynthesis protein TsaE